MGALQFNKGVSLHRGGDSITSTEIGGNAVDSAEVVGGVVDKHGVDLDIGEITGSKRAAQKETITAICAGIGRDWGGFVYTARR